MEYSSCQGAFLGQTWLPAVVVNTQLETKKNTMGFRELYEKEDFFCVSVLGFFCFFLEKLMCCGCAMMSLTRFKGPVWEI